MVLPTPEHRNGSAPELGARELVTGDLGLVVVRALLENGVGYVVSSWRDRPTAIDAAIDDARERVLAPRGVVLRRLRSLAALEPLVTSPSGGITSAPARGAVVFAGRHGLRPALEQFVGLECAGAVVGFCFDEDALRIEDAIVIEPEPTAIGLVRAIDAAFEASVHAGRPALVVIRERALGMRGTIRRRPERSPVEAAQADAGVRAQGTQSVPDVVHGIGLVEVLEGSTAVSAPTLVVSGPLRHACERALAIVAAQLEGIGAASLASDVRIVATRVPGVAPQLGSVSGSVLVIGTRAARLAERLGSDRVTAAALDADSIRGERLVAVLAAWIAEDHPDAAGLVLDVLGQLADGGGMTDAAPPALDRARIPRRSEVAHRAVSRTVAAGLTLAQGVIGVPTRLDLAYPTYRTDTGVPLTIVPGPAFAASGGECAAPGVGHGVFVVTGAVAGAMEAAGALGASVESVDGSSPRAIGAAIGQACRAPRAASHVIIVSEVQRVAAPRARTFGVDPELVGTERIASAAVPTSATVVVDLADELMTGPSALVLDHPDAHAAIEPMRALTPATWDLARPAMRGRASRMSWNLRRRMVRIVSGVDL